jgi:PAS domain S-box-containing protein
LSEICNDRSHLVPIKSDCSRLQDRAIIQVIQIIFVILAFLPVHRTYAKEAVSIDRGHVSSDMELVEPIDSLEDFINDSDTEPDFGWLYLALGLFIGAGLLGVFASIWNKRLRREVKNRTREFREVNEEDLILRRMVENLAETFLYRHDGNGIFNYISSSVKKVLGYTSEELLTEFNGYLTNHPFNQEALKLRVQSIEGYQQLPYEIQVFHKNGHLCWLKMSENPVYDENGKVVAVEGVAHDITERKLAEEKLKDSEERFKGMFDYMSSGVAIYDVLGNGEDFIFVDFNPAGEKIEKIDRKDVIGKRITEVFPGVVEFGLLDIIRRVWRTGRPEHHPITMYQDNRILGWRENFVYRLPSGEIVAVYDDVTEQKQVEEEQKRSKDFLQKVIDSVPDGLMVINRDYTIALANQVVREMIEDDQVPEGLKCHQVSHGSSNPCECEDHNCPLKEVIKTRAPVRREHVHYVKGRRTDIELIAAPIFDREGDVLQVIELCRDITERKRHENMLAAQFRLSEFAASQSVEELLRAFLDEAEKLTRSEIGFYHFVNQDQNSLHLQAWSTNTLEKLCSVEGIEEHYSIDLAGVWVDCVREGHAVIHNDYASLPHRKGLPEGHAVIIRELVVPVFRGSQMVAVLGVGNKKTDYVEDDIKTVTDLANMAWEILGRKQAEEALGESKKRYQQIFESNLAVKMIVDPEDGRIVEANDAAQQFYGYDAQTFASLHITDINTLTFEDVQREMELAITEKRKFFNFRHRLASGEIRDVEVYSGPVQTEEKTLLYSIVHDATARKQAEADREKLEAQLRQSQKMEAVGELAGGIAHDFNNLLQVILGYSDLVLFKIEEDSPIRASIEQILKAGHRSKTLVQQLLAFSRRQVLQMKDVNLNDIITDLMKMVRRVIGEHISLKVLAANDLGIVNADPGQIEQILMNLCVNARDAMENGGTIMIETENVGIDESYCETHTWAMPGRYILLSVTDTGCGMDDEILNKVFEPFFTTKGVSEGTGLGLSTVYGLVKQHQGMVDVYSEVGKGTVFKIYLPRVERSASKVEEKAEGTVPGGTETILYAEDDEQVRNLSQSILEQAGYTVLTACDGEDALRVFADYDGKIDLALLDVMMPKLGGRAVYEQIRKSHPEIHVLFSSGYSMSAIHTNFVLDKDVALIQKPYQRKDLLHRVRDVLNSNKK